MRSKNVASRSQVEQFNSTFKYAWNSEKEKPKITAEHYRVTWSIENLGLLLFEENKTVSSPTFFLDSSKTEWYIDLYPNGLCNEDRNVELFLYRSDDKGPQKVGLTFRFGVLLEVGQTLWLKEMKIECFEKKTCGSQVIDGTEKAALSECMFSFCDVFVVKCEMYVTFLIPNYYKCLLKPADYDLINFSFDFSKLMMAIEITDYRVKIPGFNINTHKAILSARSAIFRDILSDKNSSSEITLGDVSFDTIRRVLHFMYSGNVSLALRGEPPSIGLYECAQEFAVLDLAALLAPKYLRLRSVLKSQEFSYTWSVANFTKRPAFGLTSMKSPPFGIPTENAPKWYLTVNFDRISDELSVFVETTEETVSLHSILKISLLDGNGDLFNTNATTQFNGPKEKFGFPEFLKEFTNQNVMYDLLINDTLRVHCDLTFVVCSVYHEAHELTISGPSNFLDRLRNLSNDMKRLFDTSDFSDVIVKTRDNTMFDAHRSILFARSRKFYSKFMYYNKDDLILDVYDVDPDLVRLMIEHAYSGILKPMAVDDMFRLHKAADLYVCRSLSLITHYHLSSNINAGNFFSILTEAKKLKDGYLQEKCVLYLRRNAKKIVVTADWDRFRNTDKELCEFLGTMLRKRARILN